MKRAAVVLLSLFAVTLAGCGKSYTYKYKLTVYVRDYGELKKRSSVVLVREAMATDGNAAYPVLCGEATVTPLRSGKLLFGLLKGASHSAKIGRFAWTSAPTGVLLNRLGLETQWTWKNDSGLRQLPETKSEIDLQSYEMPEFVTFSDARDPKTVMRVDPTDAQKRLGGETRIEKVTLQVTDEKVTRGRVQAALPWLDPDNNFLDGSKLGEAVQGYEPVQFVNSKRCTE